MKTVSVIGLGYIGLPTAAMFASHGLRVLGVDTNEDICMIINEGKIHIEEPYLADMIKSQVAKKMISCSVEVKPADAFIIAVPTPITSQKTVDLSYVIRAAESVASVLRPGNLVVLESTVSPRCTEDVLRPILEETGLKAGEDFFLAHCPERVLPGQIIFELKHNNRVIGGVNFESAARAKELYSVFVEGEMFLTDTITAELCKLMENTYRDVNIALANELAKICERLGTNAWDVIKFANKHPRVNIHSPGPGVGGHCLAVDPWFVVEAAPDLASLIELSRITNDSMPWYVSQKVRALVAPNSKIVILGCTYKPDVGDMRESPILHLVSLLENDYDIRIVDPHVREYDVNVYQEVEGADLLLLGVHHAAFQGLNLHRIRETMRNPLVLDTRNYFSDLDLGKIGFEYHLLGVSDNPHRDAVQDKEVATAHE